MQQRRVNQDRRKVDRRAPQDVPVYDMLAWITPRPGQYLKGNNNPIYTVVQSNRYFWVKNPQGYPWDINLFDDQYIYMWITELNWTSPRDYKKTAKNWTIPFMKRYAHIGDIVKATDTTIDVVQNCQVTSSLNLGAVQCELHGPFQENLGGPLGMQSTIQIYYRWNGDGKGVFGKLEKYSLAKGYGLVRWMTQNWNPAVGAYDPPSNVSTFNTPVVGTVVPQFPCTENP